jgi:F-type H+-transporting ATPase subunit a
VAKDTGSDGGIHVDPMHQFEIYPFFGDSKEVSTLTFTNSSAFMVLIVVSIVGFLIISMRGQSLIPSRMQSVSELIYQFTYNMLRDITGNAGLKYFPYVFTVFMFVLFSNLIGMIPGSFTVTSHLAVTGALALLVFISVTVIGFVKHGLKFLKLFWPSSAPLGLRPALAVIEIISYFVRPVSHSVRLGASLFAGHVTLKVFASFVGAMGVAGILPIAAMVGLTALEFLVAVLQAYVFAILTCIYLNDAINLH